MICLLLLEKEPENDSTPKFQLSVIFLTTLNPIPIPQTLEEALKDKNWVQAMREEMNALEKNKTWEIEDLP